MRVNARIAAVVAVLALAAAPAMALATQPSEPGHQGQGKGPHYSPEPPTPPGPEAPLPEKAKAYGRYCQDQSKQHVAGQKGTPFSQCVTAMAKAAHNEKLTPRQACKEMSHKREKGEEEKGTPFSRCVKAAAKLRHQQQQES
jgi:hypothetical protein